MEVLILKTGLNAQYKITRMKVQQRILKYEYKYTNITIVIIPRSRNMNIQIQRFIYEGKHMKI